VTCSRCVLPNYDVSTAEKIFPASELSEQISTAGTEASGTGNMKMSLNGALTIARWTVPTSRYARRWADENIFIFGLTTPEVAELRAHGYNPWDYYNGNAELRQVLDMIATVSSRWKSRSVTVLSMRVCCGTGQLSAAGRLRRLYCRAGSCECALSGSDEWTRRAILNVARMGKFSSDRTIQEYAEKVWA